MHRSFLILLAAVLIPQGMNAQKDPEAQKVLDRISSRSRADFPLKVSFEYIYRDLVEKQTGSQRGTLILEEDKYRLSLGESTVYCDGTTVWNYLSSANEVYISDAAGGEQADDFFISDPSDLFTFYQEGFKYRLSGEIEHEGRVLSEISIYPEDLDKDYHTVKLLVHEKDSRIYSAEAYGKHGMNHTVILTDYLRKVRTDEKTFVFDPADYPGVEVVDTRF
jgi:outer membrane lipoprotein-sorting protein